MLSPHEFATLMLVRDASDPAGMDRAELDALLEHQLVALEKLASGGGRFSITCDGDPILPPVARINPCRTCRSAWTVYSRDPAGPSPEPVPDRHSGAS